MYCPKCGTLNDDRSVNCSRCDTPLNPAGTPPGMIQPGMIQPGAGPGFPAVQPPTAEIPTYMTQSVLITLFCCLPLGIVGIFKANKINKLMRQNDVQGALVASKENKTMLWIAFGVGLVINVVYVLVSMNKT